MGADPKSTSRTTLSKARRALRELAAKTPESNELYGILLDLGRPRAESKGMTIIDHSVESRADSEVAIIGAAYVEYGLEKAITLHLSPRLVESDITRVFKGDHERPGALSDFADKIEVAYALGIIEQTVRDDLHTIRIIRNSFAHSMFRLSMQSTEVSDLLGKINLGLSDYMGDVFRIASMRRLHASYVMSVYYWRLVTYTADRPLTQPFPVGTGP